MCSLIRKEFFSFFFFCFVLPYFTLQYYIGFILKVNIRTKFEILPNLEIKLHIPNDSKFPLDQ